MFSVALAVWSVLHRFEAEKKGLPYEFEKGMKKKKKVDASVLRL